MYTFYLLACQVSHTAGDSVRSLWLYLCVMNMEVEMMGCIYIYLLHQHQLIDCVKVSSVCTD